MSDYAGLLRRLTEPRCSNETRDEAAAAIEAQAEEIGRLRELLAEADTIEQSIVSDSERADFWTRLRAALKGRQP